MYALIDNFETAFHRLVSGEKIDLYEAGISSDFEYIAMWLFKEIRPHHWYDGVNGLEGHRRKGKQIEFSGEMWVADIKNSNQWLEPFRSRVTDMRGTNQGLRISMDIGDFHAEGDLLNYPNPSNAAEFTPKTKA